MLKILTLNQKNSHQWQIAQLHSQLPSKWHMMITCCLFQKDKDTCLATVKMDGLLQSKKAKGLVSWRRSSVMDRRTAQLGLSHMLSNRHYFLLFHWLSLSLTQFQRLSWDALLHLRNPRAKLRRSTLAQEICSSFPSSILVWSSCWSISSWIYQNGSVGCPSLMASIIASLLDGIRMLEPP